MHGMTSALQMRSGLRKRPEICDTARAVQSAGQAQHDPAAANLPTRPILLLTGHASAISGSMKPRVNK